LSAYANVYVLDAQRWMQAGGRQAYDPRLWHLGKIPFGNPVFKEAASDIKAALRALTGESRKLVVLDLDDTLWGGVLGDDGWEALRLGGAIIGGRMSSSSAV
jgi:predicted enzyme involved in methoxymalonyl-ACP biosynthesis